MLLNVCAAILCLDKDKRGQEDFDRANWPSQSFLNYNSDAQEKPQLDNQISAQTQIAKSRSFAAVNFPQILSHFNPIMKFNQINSLKNCPIQTNKLFWIKWLPSVTAKLREISMPQEDTKKTILSKSWLEKFRDVISVLSGKHFSGGKTWPPC